MSTKEELEYKLDLERMKLDHERVEREDKRDRIEREERRDREDRLAREDRLSREAREATMAMQHRANSSVLNNSIASYIRYRLLISVLSRWRCLPLSVPCS